MRSMMCALRAHVYSATVRLPNVSTASSWRIRWWPCACWRTRHHRFYGVSPVPSGCLEAQSCLWTLLLSSLCTTILSLWRDVMGHPRAPPSAETRPLVLCERLDCYAGAVFRSRWTLGGWEVQLPRATHPNQTAYAACTPAFVRRLCLLRSILGNRGHVRRLTAACSSCTGDAARTWPD